MAINLLPWREAAYQKKQRMFLLLLVVCSFLIVIFCVMWRARIERKCTRLLVENQRLEKSINQKSNSSEGDKHIFLRYFLIKRSWVLYQFLLALSEVSIRQGSLEKLSYDGKRNRVLLVGRLADGSELEHLISQWSQFPLVDALHLIHQRKENGCIFTVMMTLGE